MVTEYDLHSITRKSKLNLGRMQVTAMFQKWNHFWRMADIYTCF